VTAIDEMTPTIADVSKLTSCLDAERLGAGAPLEHLAKWQLAVILEQGYQRANGDPKLDALGPVILDLMRGAAELAETSDYQR
jgi:hypothetical protein